MKHRKEEDELYRKFAKKREEEDRRVQDEIQVGFCKRFLYDKNYQQIDVSDIKIKSV